MNEFQIQVEKTITEKGATAPCQRCGNKDLAVVPNHIKIVLQNKPKEINLSGDYIPCAMVICVNCGNIVLHALKGLGVEE